MYKSLAFLIPVALTVGLAQDPAWNAPPEAKKLKNKVVLTGEKMDAVGQLYAARCVSCHGVSGNSYGPAAAALAKEPANFTDAKVLNKLKDGELFWKISNGRAPMPGFSANLSENDRWQLVNYVRYLTERAQYRYLGYRRTPNR